MRVVFMGTPDFAVPVFEKILAAGHEITLAVTQPDRPKGRGKELAPPPVKEAALSAKVPVFQPVKVRAAEAVERIRQEAPDIAVVAAFGQILPEELLAVPKYGCINVHASLLPKYRGASPIQWAVLSGEKESGVTIMQMDAGLDTGDILLQERMTLAPDETAGSLFDRLSVLGAELCVRTMEKIAAGTIQRTPQDDAKATKTGRIDKQFGQVDWERPAGEIECLIRAMAPWPSAYTRYRGKGLKLWRAEVLPARRGVKPGTVTEIVKDGLLIETGEGTLKLKELQLEGKKRMQADAFLRGCPVQVGEVLG